eukprot:RCo013618
MNLLVGASHITAVQREHFWRALLSYLAGTAHARLQLPRDEVWARLSALLPHYQSLAKPVADELCIGLPSPVSAGWLESDTFDYQVEDREVQWGLLGLSPPAVWLPQHPALNSLRGTGAASGG